MSDAQLSLDAGERESDPSQRSGEHADDAGVILAASPDAWSGAPNRKAAAVDAEIEGEATVPAYGPEPIADVTTGEAADDELQPMLDLGLPEIPGHDPVPEETPILALEPAASQADEFSMRDDLQQETLVEPEAHGQPEAAGAQQWPQDDARDAEQAAAIPMEISPIFSALDAAESAAKATEDETIIEPVVFDTGDASPLTHLIDRLEATVAPAESVQALEMSANGRPKADTSLEGSATSEHTPSHEVPPTNDAADTPSEDDQTHAPEELNDDAAARIAAEASATTAALENLRRLLAQKFPQPDLGTVLQDVASPEHTSPPPIPVYRPPVQLPVAPPAMVAAPLAETASSLEAYADAPPRRSWVAVSSFCAGFALSWVFGAVLYVFLTSG